MTCIAAYKDDDGSITIAADSRVSYGDFIRSHTEKIFKKGNILFGVSGALRQCQILQHELIMPEHSGSVDDLGYLCGIFGKAFRDKLKECDAWDSESGRPDTNISGIVAYKCNIYHMSSDLSFLKSLNRYEAAGSGQEIALGALAVLEDAPLTPHEKLTKAIEITARYIKSVDDRVIYQILEAA